MNIEQIRDYCLKKMGTTEDFPFNPDTLVFKVLGKMYALIALDKWEIGEKAINLKCDPDYALELRAEYNNIDSGYHMSKTHWNTVKLNDGEISASFLIHLIDHSYEMVVKGMPKKLKDQLK